MKDINKELSISPIKPELEHFPTCNAHMIACMSHEIRTPMTAIMGFTELALNEEMSEQVRGYVKNINAVSISLLSMLQDILDCTKLETGHVTLEALPFNVLDLLNIIDTLFKSSAQKKDLSFTISRDSTIPLELIGDMLRLQQVLTNLLSNAIKFTAQGSVKLHISLQSINLSQAQLLFSVTDTGIGIALEDQSKLFKDYSQVDSSITRLFGGTGLGLVISKDLVELMGGEISVVSNPHQGSNFSFSLPFELNKSFVNHMTQIETIVPSIPIKSSPNKLKGHRVLVVDDNVCLRKLIEKQLLYLGVDSIMAENGKEALSLLEQYDFDAVLMDIYMPIMDGFEATYLIRQQAKFASLPIISLSAALTELERNNYMTYGMNDYIFKPFNIEQLCATLEPWLKPNSA